MSDETKRLVPVHKSNHWTELHGRLLLHGLLPLPTQVHDTLVNQEGMDASSDAYYTAIEQRVKDKFVDKWDHWQKVAAEAAATAAAAEKAAADQAAAAQAAAQAQRVQQIQVLRGFTGSPVRASQNYTSFKVPLKDATPGGMGPSGPGEQYREPGGSVCLPADVSAGWVMQSRWPQLVTAG